MIDEAVAPFAGNPDLEMSTLRRRIDDAAEVRNPNVTKWSSTATATRCISRAPMPYAAEGCPPWPGGTSALRLSPRVPAAPRGAAADGARTSEALEQLRALEHGIRIKAMETAFDSIGVDTPDDLERVRRLVRPPSAVRRS